MTAASPAFAAATASGAPSASRTPMETGQALTFHNLSASGLVVRTDAGTVGDAVYHCHHQRFADTFVGLGDIEQEG